jgi:hypothetical protein
MRSDVTSAFAPLSGPKRTLSMPRFISTRPSAADLEVPAVVAASSCRNFKSKSESWLRSALLLPKFVSEGAAICCSVPVRPRYLVLLGAVILVGFSRFGALFRRFLHFAASFYRDLQVR